MLVYKNGKKRYKVKKSVKNRFKQGVFVNDGFFSSIQGGIIEQFTNYSITALMFVRKNDKNRYKKRKKRQKNDKKSQKNGIGLKKA